MMPDHTPETEPAANATATTAESSATPAPPALTPPPRRSVRWWMLLLAILIGVTLFVLGVYFSDTSREAYERSLVLMGAEHDHEEGHDEGWWTCGMHPWVILPSPDDGCPICGMDLVPLDPDKFTGEISIDPVVVQNIGVRIGEVTTGRLDQELRTVGTVVIDERAVHDVNTRFSGWIEDLEIDETGEQVNAGDVLFTVYSPELYAAVEEYRLAQASAGRATTGPAADVQRELLEAAEEKLALYGLGRQEIAALSDEPSPTGTIALRSPMTGTVLEKTATQGMRVEPGMRIYQIADLSTVWVEAAVYEDQLPFVEVGQTATMTLPYLRGETFEGEVTFVSPILDAGTRQGTVRLEFPNERGRLKPGMYAQVRLQSRAEDEVALVPREAILDTGQRQVALVSLGGGRFEPRDVTLGSAGGGGMVQVLEGLEPGEQVVTSGQFLLDSEAQMREGLAKMLTGDQAADQGTVVETAAQSELSSLPQPAAEQIETLLDAYLSMGEVLADDQLEGLEPLTETIATAAEALGETELPDRPDFWDEHGRQVTTLREQSQAMAEAQDLEQARHEYAVMSDALHKLLRATGVPSSFDEPLYSFVCGFLDEAPRGGVWLQAGNDPHNPLMGESSGMLACHVAGETRQLPVTGGATTAPASEGDSTTESTTAVEDGQAVPMVAMPPDMARPLKDLLQRYVLIHEALAADSTENVEQNADRLAEAAQRLVPEAPSLDVAPIAEAAQELKRNADDLKAARLAFAEAGNRLLPVLRETGVPATLPMPLLAARCPMYPPGEASWWIQRDGEIRNPFYAQRMPGCFDEREQLPTTPVAGE